MNQTLITFKENNKTISYKIYCAKYHNFWNELLIFIFKE